MEPAPELAGRLYLDGHVRVDHGHQTPLPKRYVAREKLCLRGTTDYWINDREGRPFFVVNTAANPGLIAVLRQEIIPRLLKEVPHQPTEEELPADPYRFRFVMIFDREGYRPELFAELWAQRIAAQTDQKQGRAVEPPPGRIWCRRVGGAAGSRGGRSVSEPANPIAAND